MRLTVNGTTYVDFTAAIAIDDGADLDLSWDPVSGCAGFAREAFGYELGGVFGTMAPDIEHIVIEVLDPDDEATVLATTAPVRYPEYEMTYTAAMNETDHDGAYETDMLLRVVQIGHDGRRTVLGTIETT